MGGCGCKFSVESIFNIEQYQPGDHGAVLRVKGGGLIEYFHHFIVCKNGKVIEYDMDEEKSASSKLLSPLHKLQASLAPEKGVIKEGTLEKYKQEKTLLRYNYEGGVNNETVQENARKLLHRRKYNLFRENCESFAIICKTAIVEDRDKETLEKSEQIDTLFKLALAEGILYVAKAGCSPFIRLLLLDDAAKIIVPKAVNITKSVMRFGRCFPLKFAIASGVGLVLVEGVVLLSFIAYDLYKLREKHITTTIFEHSCIRNVLAASGAISGTLFATFGAEFIFTSLALIFGISISIPLILPATIITTILLSLLGCAGGLALSGYINDQIANRTKDRYNQILKFVKECNDPKNCQIAGLSSQNIWGTIEYVRLIFDEDKSTSDGMALVIVNKVLWYGVWVVFLKKGELQRDHMKWKLDLDSAIEYAKKLFIPQRCDYA